MDATEEERTGEMIDPETAYVGMKVIRKSDGTQHKIIGIQYGQQPYWLGTGVGWFAAEHLDPIDPPAPKRVEVVTETRTVVKEVVLRLPVDIAKQIASVCGLPGWDEYSKQIHAALAAQEAK